MSGPGPWEQPPKAGAHKTSRLGLFLWLGAVAATGLVVFALNRAFPQGGTPLGDPGLVQTLGFLALVSSSLLFVRQINLKQTARNILAWVAVGGVLIIGFSFQDELKDLGLRLRSSVIPGYPVKTGPGEMVLSESDGGSFQVYGTINGLSVRFLVDTGASDIVISPSDARRLGIDPASLTFNHPYESANGIGHGASTEVADLSVGDIHLSNVPVAINGAEMSSSLLGMTFLRRLKSYSVSGRKLTLRW